jgi:hypothetical protein
MGSGAQGIKRVRFAISLDQLSQDFFRGTRESDNRDEVILLFKESECRLDLAQGDLALGVRLDWQR